MTGGMGGRGFFAGAIGGLALAALLVGAVTLLPQASVASRAPVATSFTASSSSTTYTCSSCLATAGTTSRQPSAAFPSAASQATPTGGAALSSVSTTTAQTTSINTAGKTSTSAAQAAQRPASLLGALQGEGITNLLGTVSPLLIGLLVAALVYGAYARRQNSSD